MPYASCAVARWFGFGTGAARAELVAMLAYIRWVPRFVPTVSWEWVS